MNRTIQLVLLGISLSLLTGGFAAASSIQLPQTGQTTSYAAGDDGAIRAGLASPSPRFTAANGAVTDNLTGLVWLQNANCTETVGGIARGSGSLTWANALTWSNALASGACGLTDGSSAGQWRLPTRLELESLVDVSKFNPALPTGHPFSGAQYYNYWSSSSYALNTVNAWYVLMDSGIVSYGGKASGGYVWPVRAGQ